MRREPDLAFRLLGLGAVTILTQFNWLANDPSIRRNDLHVQVTLVELLWILAVVVLQRLSRRTGSVDRLRPLWIVIDVVMLTVLIRLLEAASSVLIVGYPILVVASGLWARLHLVWLTVGLSIAGYATLWVESVLRVGYSRNFYLNIVVASLLVTGLVVSHQVRRFRALSRYYEQQPARR